MHNKNRVINKLALVLISIVVLELVLIGDQVQPVKAIKKKIYLKKLKKLLPLFALVKPKKKIILLPIPIPMFKSHSSHHQATSQHTQLQHHGRPTVQQYIPMQPPMSFVMMDTDKPGHNPSFMSFPMDGSMSASMSMSSSNDIEPILTEPTTTTTAAGPGPSNASTVPSESASAFPLMSGPSMTMTIQSKPDGGSNIELSTNINGPSSESAALMQPPHRPFNTKWRPHSPAKQIQKQPHQAPIMQLSSDHFEEPSEQQPGGEHYYSSPWGNRSPLVSPAKILHRPQLQQPLTNWSPPAHHSGRLMRPQQQPQLQQVAPVRPQLLVPMQTAQLRQPAPMRFQQQQQLIDQQLSQALESEDLMPVGPAQVMAAYPGPNGQLHIPLPPMHRPAHIEQEQERAPLQSGDDQSDEVQTVGRPETGANSTPRPKQQQSAHPLQQQSKSPTQPTSGRLISPAIKGKQQQQTQGTKQKPIVSGGY